MELVKNVAKGLSAMEGRLLAINEGMEQRKEDEARVI